MEDVMRRVVLIEEPSGQRPWVAVDQATRQPLLRHFNVDHLRNICDRLGWQMVEAEFASRARPNPHPPARTARDQSFARG
jgi:hypothetical protein